MKFRFFISKRRSNSEISHILKAYKILKLFFFEFIELRTLVYWQISSITYSFEDILTERCHKRPSSKIWTFGTHLHFYVVPYGYWDIIQYPAKSITTNMATVFSLVKRNNFPTLGSPLFHVFSPNMYIFIFPIATCSHPKK